MRRIIVAIIGLSVLVAACSTAARGADGEIVEAGSESAFDLRVGDCFDDPSDLDNITSVHAVPCAEDHDNEVYANLTMSGGSYPGEGAVGQWADDNCYAEFAGYVGSAWEVSELDYGFLAPTAESWDRQSDRTVSCILYDGDLAKLSGSMRNSGV